MNGPRSERVGDAIRTELAAILQRDMGDPRVRMVSVTDVRLRGDFGVADIYISSLSATNAAARAALVRVLTRAAGFLRRQLASRQMLRTTPRLRFHYDDLIAGGARLEALIDGVTPARCDAR